jgi:hypothetical protein
MNYLDNMTLIILIIILTAAVFALGYGCYNLIKQNESLEEVVVFYQTKFEEIREKSLQTEIQLKELDIKGSFEADDEVGFVFKTIKDINSELTQTIQTTYEFSR